ncbi:ATP-binding response regulator [Desulfonema magnum]|nr:hybrid sensor histidine kinase/response regulator [Desulfonema magnum]
MNIPPSDPAKSDILIVDDTVAILHLLSDILKGQGYKVRSVTNGAMAIKAAGASPPDIILLDIRMPEMNGYDVCNQLKADERTHKIPIIFLSALDEMSDKVKAFSMGGVDYITKPFQPEEVLARVQTHLTLRNLQKCLEEKNILLQQEVIERKRAEEALQKAHDHLEVRVQERTAELSISNAELAKALRLKDDFLSTISHELRTPLNPILGFSSALNSGLLGTLSQEQQEAVVSIEKSGRHLLELINDILNFAQISAGELELKITPVSTGSICSASLELIRKNAEKKHLKIFSSVDRDAVVIQADERRVKQILVHLLSNAVKFTPKGGSIGLETKADSEKQVIYFTIWDTGIGIAKEDMARLFRPFLQLDSGLSRRYEGTGLGLVLAYNMAKLHGGNISVSSEAGKGSRFTVRLPWKAQIFRQNCHRTGPEKF